MTTPSVVPLLFAVTRIRVVCLWFVCWSLSLQSSKHHLCKSNFYSSFSSRQAYSTTSVVMLHFTTLNPTDTLSVIVILTLFAVVLPPFGLSKRDRVNGSSVLYQDYKIILLKLAMVFLFSSYKMFCLPDILDFLIFT